MKTQEDRSTSIPHVLMAAAQLMQIGGQLNVGEITILFGKLLLGANESTPWEEIHVPSMLAEVELRAGVATNPTSKAVYTKAAEHYRNFEAGKLSGQNTSLDDEMRDALVRHLTGMLFDWVEFMKS